jgi:hypothetical protein
MARFVFHLQQVAAVGSRSGNPRVGGSVPRHDTKLMIPSAFRHVLIRLMNHLIRRDASHASQKSTMKESYPFRYQKAGDKPLQRASTRLSWSHN